MTNYYGYNCKKYDNAELVKRNKKYAEKMRGFYEKLFNNHLTIDALQYMDAEDIEMIKVKDHCDKPKESGYRSLHVVVAIPVYLVNTKKMVPVEIQFRSIVMDAWASLEHELRYKNKGELKPEIVDSLKECAESLHYIDERLSKIRHEVLKDDNKYSDY